MNIDERFKGMTAVVTGASRGIGAETAFALASRGAFGLAHYNTSHEAGARLLDRIRASGGEAELVQADLSQSNGGSHPTWIHRGFSRERIDQSALQVSRGELLPLVDPGEARLQPA